MFVALREARAGDAPPSRSPRSCARRGLRVEMEQAGRSLKGQLKQADRIGARVTVILGDSIEVKDMETGEQREAAGPDEAVGDGRGGTRA